MTFDEFLKFIRLGENPRGSYDTLFNDSQMPGKPFEGTNVSQMTLDELYKFSDPSGAYGQYVKRLNPKNEVATPMGFFQIVGRTLRDFAKRLNLPGDTVFSKDIQDKLGRAIYESQGQAAFPGAVKAMNKASATNQGPKPLKAPGLFNFMEANKMQPNNQTQARGGLLQSIFGGGGPRTLEDEQARLRRLQFAQSLNALIMPELRMDMQNQIDSQRDIVNRNRSISLLRQRAATGDRLAQAALSGLEGGADIGTVMGAYLQQSMRRPKTFNVDGKIVDEAGNVIFDGNKSGYTDDQTKLMSTLRDDLRKDVETYAIVSNGYDTIAEFYKAPSGVSDYALAVAFAKILDPGSVAREGEVNAVRNAGALFPNLKAELTNAITGEGTFSQETRDQIIDLALRTYNQKAEQARKQLAGYQRIAEKGGLTLDDIYSGPMFPEKTTPKGPNDVPPVPSDMTRTVKGQTRPITQKEWEALWFSKTEAQRNKWLETGSFN
tara:strand:+ start:3546 stop:5021 length:1476 start_codon:yes stop_codon:yes gene_type:complete